MTLSMKSMSLLLPASSALLNAQLQRFGREQTPGIAEMSPTGGSCGDASAY